MRLCRIWILLASLLLSRTLNASKRDPVVAERLFNQGRIALAQGDYATACKKFEESERLDPAAGTLMNRATCEQRRGRIATAWQLWRDAVDRLDPDDDRIQFARSRARELEPRLPRLTLKPAFPTSARVTVIRDGIPMSPSSLSLPLRIDPGSHVILVRKAGHAAQRYRIDLAEREQHTLLIQVGPKLPRPASQATGSAPTWGYVLTGIGLAGIGGAVVTHGMLEEKRDRVAANCPNKVCNEQGFAAVQEGKSLTLLNRALWLVGGTAFAGGAVLLIVGSGSSGSEQGVALAVSPRTVGLVHKGKF